MSRPTYFLLFLAIGASLLLWRDNRRKSAEIKKLRAQISASRHQLAPPPDSSDLADRIAAKKRQIDEILENIQRAKAAAASDDPDYFQNQAEKAKDDLRALNDQLHDLRDDETATVYRTKEEKAEKNADRKQTIAYWDAAIHDAQAAVQSAALALKVARRRRYDVAERAQDLNSANATLQQAKDGKNEALAQLDEAAATSDAGNSALNLKRSRTAMETERARLQQVVIQLEEKTKTARATRDAAAVTVNNLESDYRAATDELAGLERQVAGY